MRAILLAFTTTTPAFDRLAEELEWEPTSPSLAEGLLEFAGRNCYQSWHKPNPATADTDAYLDNVKAQNHLSVVEHATVSFYLEDVSRSLTHELVRHRHFSFSQLSQRYVDPSTQKPVIPPLFRGDRYAETIILESFLRAVHDYRLLVAHADLVIGSQSRKQIREAARAVLPNSTPTRIVVSGNFRSWLEFIEKRDSAAADREIAGVAKAMRLELEKVAPAVFDRRPVTLSEQMAPKAVEPEYPPGQEPT